mgnify:CR=1 FL=1
MRKALVCGAGGFIGSHLVTYLKNKGYWVRGVDIKYPEFSRTNADEFLILDLRGRDNCRKALTIKNGSFDEVYQLAADMGGMGFIHSAECDIMHNSALINLNLAHIAIKEFKVPMFFFSSSVCVYRDMKKGEKIDINYSHPYPLEFALIEEAYKIAKIDKNIPKVMLTREYIDEVKKKLKPEMNDYINKFYKSFKNLNLNK